MILRRRTWLQSVIALVIARPWARVRAFAQASALSGADVATLAAIAEVVLPRAIGADGRKAAVARFVGWVRNYREGADRGHGYGRSTLSAPTGPSPAARYPAQFAALNNAAAASGAASFAALSLDGRRALIEAALNARPQVTRMPARPTGADVIVDFMGFYFNSADAHDLCYQRAIGRDQCRGLAGSENAPATRGSDPFSTESASLVPEVGVFPARPLAPKTPTLWKGGQTPSGPPSGR